MTEMAKIQFLSDYRGEGDYRVLTGPLAGERISIRYMDPDWYLKDFEENAGRVWHIDRGAYHREVMTSVGIVRRQGHFEPVTPDVMAAVDARFKELDAQWEGQWRCSFSPGRYVPGEGWKPVPRSELLDTSPQQPCAGFHEEQAIAV